MRREKETVMSKIYGTDTKLIPAGEQKITPMPGIEPGSAR
jgi:hypothetical protein